MNFFLACFGVGLLSTLGVGPIFILTFNRAAMYGFLRGFATALGSALADACLFALGLAGFLSFIGKSKNVYLTLDLVGGFALIYMGINYFSKTINIDDAVIQKKENLFIIFINSFFITVVNPGAIIYFTYMSIQVSENIEQMVSSYYMIGVLMLAAGTLSSFTVVSLVSSRLGNIVTPKRLQMISRVTGVLLIFVGIYFLYDFVRNGNLIMARFH